MDQTPEITKVCNKCGEEKATSEFHTRIKRGKTVLRPRCIGCERSDNTVYNRTRYTPHPRPKVTEKACTRCGRTFPIEDFPIHDHATGKRRARCAECSRADVNDWRVANLEAERQRGREKYSAHRDEYLETQRRFAEEHPDEVRARNRRYRAAHRDEINERSREFYQTHKEEVRLRQERYRLRHPEKYKAIHRRWVLANNAASRAITHRRRARLIGNGGSFTAAEWETLKALCENRCLMCGRCEPAITLTIDHVVPLSLGGTNEIGNIQPLCNSCNSKKHTQTLDLRSKPPE